LEKKADVRLRSRGTGSVHSTYPARSSYDASAGYLGSELRIGLERQLTERLRFDGSAKLWINNGAENSQSPLYQDDQGLGVQAAFIWTLGTSERRGK